MKIKCPKCSQHYEISADFIGKPIECQICSTTFTADIIVEQFNIKKNIKRNNLNPNDLTGTVKISKDNIWKNWK
jgi:arginyl-tRNA--protein-N-Asp/Glu arginylyltransferase